MNHRNLIAWVGGKRLLRPVIEKFIPEKKSSYIEPFGGAGWVLFYRDRWAELEIYNDLDSRLVNLFRVVKYHPDELKKEMNLMLASREMFNSLYHTELFTDIQRAARFLFLISFSFGAKGVSFATAKAGGRGIKSVLNINEKIDSIAKRLDKVLVENKDFQDLFNIYDHKDAFFYCDPPYTQGEGYVVTSTKDFDHQKLKECLVKLKGKFLLSYDDSPLVAKLYKGFKIYHVERLTGIYNKRGKASTYKEVLICNYDIQKPDLMVA